MIYKIAIGGCRNFNNYNVFKEFVNECISSFKGEIIIISGKCRGVDCMAERYAAEKSLGLELFPAEWKKYGRSAGPIRNKVMVQRADIVIAFWDGKSKGTKSLINNAKVMGKVLYIKNITQVLEFLQHSLQQVPESQVLHIHMENPSKHT